MTNYILGLLTADGSTQEYLTIKNATRYNSFLELTDEQIILDISNQLNKEVSYRERIINNKLRKFWKISFVSQEMQDFGKYLIKGRPNINELHENLDEQGKVDFMRGLFDGDGTICLRKSGSSCIGFSVNSTCAGILKIIENFCKQYNLKLSKYFDKRGNGSWFYSINKKEDKIKFAKIIYKGNPICLKRKKEKFIEIFGNELII